jgi:hypothetical protein
MANWYANLIYVGRAQMVMATSERSLLTVLLPAADLRKALVASLGELTYLLLQEIVNPTTGSNPTTNPTTGSGLVSCKGLDLGASHGPPALHESIVTDPLKRTVAAD